MAEPLKALNLKRWIDDHRSLLKPPVGAEMIWKDSQFMVMIIGGPNARRDFHIDPRDEFFYQLEGDMVLEYIDGRGKRQCEKIREGEYFCYRPILPILHSGRRIRWAWWWSQSEVPMNRKATPGIASGATPRCTKCPGVKAMY